MATLNQVDVNTTSDQINTQLTTLTEKYLGTNQYILSGAPNNGYIGLQIAAMSPWSNLADRYFPTVATLSQSGNNIVTKDQLGYFTPNNVGASVYLTKNIIPVLNTNEINANQVYTYLDPSKYNKGRGFTGKDQNNIVTHIENLNWQKALGTGTEFDGQILGSTDYQKFIPYQSAFETTKTDTNGVINVKNDFEFWTGNYKNIWLTTDKFTEQDWLQYFDIDSRVQRLLVNVGELYSWQTDVYGNQYALYKQVPAAGRTIYNMQNATGQLWVKTVDGTIYSAVSALSGIFNKYASQPGIYSQLSANNIKNIEIFYDTLVFELSGYTIYEKITFDYTTSTINPYGVDYLPLDYHTQLPTRTLSSLSLSPTLSTAGLTGIYAISNNSNVYYGGHWYNESDKTMTACLLLSANLQSTTTAAASALSSIDLIVPVLYQYNINTPNTRTRIFPDNNTNFSAFLYAKGASAIDPELEHITYIEPPVITYNKDVSSYVISFIGYNWQKFNIISYTTNQNVLGKILVDGKFVPITTGTGNTILTV